MFLNVRRREGSLSPRGPGSLLTLPSSLHLLTGQAPDSAHLAAGPTGSVCEGSARHPAPSAIQGSLPRSLCSVSASEIREEKASVDVRSWTQDLECSESPDPSLLGRFTQTALTLGEVSPLWGFSRGSLPTGPAPWLRNLVTLRADTSIILASLSLWGRSLPVCPRTPQASVCFCAFLFRRC